MCLNIDQLANVDVNIDARYPSDSDAATYETGLYKLPVVNETSNGSTSETLIEERNGEYIWKTSDAYHWYSEEFDVSSKNATIYVYAYDASGNIIAYQSQAYPIV